jgi:hypothetical protein
LLFQVEPVIRTSPAPTRAIVNAGLWLDDPDVDAITRLCNDIVATECDALALPLFAFCIFLLVSCSQFGAGTPETPHM